MLSFSAKSLLKRRISSFLGRFGYVEEGYTRKHIPFGVDWRLDVSHYLTGGHIDNIFDVGANRGQTVKEIIEYFGSSRIFCFEPNPEAFYLLRQNTAAFTNVRCFETALGSCTGNVSMTADGASGQNTLVTDKKRTPADLVMVEMDTLDNFCAANHVNSISVLKIDTEGYEMSILQGGEELLKQGRVGFVLAECDFGWRADNDPHGDFFEIFEYLSAIDFDIVSLYTEGIDHRGWRWGNVLFKHKGVKSPETTRTRHHGCIVLRGA